MAKITEQSFTDVMVLGQCHSLMASRLPTDIPMSTIAKDYGEAMGKLKDTKQSFGLFSSGINYNTYYPDAKPEDIAPQDADFVEPMFRLISACVLAKKNNPTDFSTPGVLEDSMMLLKGQSLYCDHDTDVGNAIGVVKEVSWQPSFEQDGVTVPAGINGILKIDGKSNPRIARGVMMDPPSIHSNSVTVTFSWKPSHEFDSVYEFYDKLGTYDEKGEMIRRIVTKVINYQETSLVYHGADPFAQKLVDGKLNHIAYAARQYYGVMENSEKLIKEMPDRVFAMLDFKQGDNNQVDTMSNSATTKQNNINKNQDENSMNEEMMAFVASLFGTGMLQLKGGETPTMELAKSHVGEMLKEATTLKATIESLKPKAAIGTAYLSEVREATLANYQKLAGEAQDEAILSLLNNEAIDLGTLKALDKMYVQQLEAKFPMTCSNCGSHNVNRGSSVSASEEGDGGDEGGQGDHVHEDVGEESNASEAIGAISAITRNKLK